MKPSLGALDSASRQWRTGLLLACAIAGAGWAVVTLQCSPVMPWCATSMGMNVMWATKAAGVVITNVDPLGPASSAGVHAGDRIDFPDIPFRERWRLRDIVKGYGGVAGERLRYVVLSGTRVFAASVVPKRIAATWLSPTDVFDALVFLWPMLFAAILAARRPDLIEARLLSLLLVFLTGAQVLTGLFVSAPPLEFAIQTPSAALYLAIPAVCLTLLSGLYARPLSRIRKLLQWTSLVAAAVGVLEAAILYVLGFVFALPVFWIWYRPAFDLHVGFARLCDCRNDCNERLATRQALLDRDRRRASVAILRALQSYLSGVRPEAVLLRQRVFCGATKNCFCVAAGGTNVCDTEPSHHRYWIRRQPRHRFRSALPHRSRDLFLIVEWALGTWASGASRTTGVIVNVTVALAIGFSIRFLHTRTERVVDQVFFRKRHEDETALRRFAREAAFITERQALLDATETVLERHSDASTVELLLRDGANQYVTATSNSALERVSENDSGVLAMRARHEPIDLHETGSALQGEMAFPISSRGRLLGVLVCGPKRAGEAYAPDELDAILAVALGVGSALDVMTNRGDGYRREILEGQAAILDLQQQMLAELRRISAKLT